jgi:hypothetical protein
MRAIEAARERAQQRRQHVSDAERAYERFLEQVATPLARQVASSLKAEGYPFTVFTPAGGLRISSERGRDDYIEIVLDRAADPPQVLGRVSQTRGSRTESSEQPIRPGAPPDTLTEEDVLSFLIRALEPWLEH